jgi:transposase
MPDPLNTLAFVGVDTHKDEHSACMTDCFRQILGTLTVPNRPDRFEPFIEHIEQIATAKQLTPVFGLEDVRGLGQHLARSLMDHGYLLKEVNPIQTDRKRRHRAHPDKSDPEDALAIAKVLIDDFDQLPTIDRFDELFLSIQQLSGRRDSLVKEQTRIRNQLHMLLHREYPYYQEMFKDICSKAALAFWDRFPNPALLKGTGVKRLANYLRANSHNTVSTQKAVTILKLVDKELPASAQQAVHALLIRGLVQHWRFICEQMKTIEEHLKPLIQQTGQKLNTLTGVDTVIEAKLIAHIGDVNRFAYSDKLAKCAGIAPKQKSSGKKLRFNKSNKGRRQLNSAIYQIALCQIACDRSGNPKNPKARAYFLKKIAEGKTKKEALTCLQRRLCDIIYSMMKNKSEYRLSFKHESPQPKSNPTLCEISI